MPVIFSPKEFRSEGDYVIVSYEQTAPILHKVLSFLYPKLNFVGLCDDIGLCLEIAGRGIAVVSAHPNGFFSGAYLHESFYFIPYAEGNLASFWHFGFNLLCLLDPEDGRIDRDKYLRAAVSSGACVRDDAGSILLRTLEKRRSEERV